MTRPVRRKQPSFTIPPKVAILGAIILGFSYAGTEIYKYHNSYQGFQPQTLHFSELHK